MNKKVLKRIIIISWLLLIISFVIKIFGGSWFNVAFSTEPMFRADAFLEKHYLAQVIVFSIGSYIGFSFYYLAICQKRNFDKFLHIALVPYFVAVTAIKVWLYSVGATNWGLLLDIVTGFIIPFVLIGKPKKKYFRVIIAFGLYLIFMAISLSAKNIRIDPAITESVLTEIILGIDLYMMLLLFYLYSLHLTKEKVKDEQIIHDIFGEDRGREGTRNHA